MDHKHQRIPHPGRSVFRVGRPFYLAGSERSQLRKPRVLLRTARSLWYSLRRYRCPLLLGQRRLDPLGKCFSRKSLGHFILVPGKCYCRGLSLPHCIRRALPSMRLCAKAPLNQQLNKHQIKSRHSESAMTTQSGCGGRTRFAPDREFFW